MVMHGTSTLVVCPICSYLYVLSQLQKMYADANALQYVF